MHYVPQVITLEHQRGPDCNRGVRDPQMREFRHRRINLVLLGEFNPAIFQPSWLAHNKLIREEQATGEALSIGLIHPEVSDFKTGWLHLQVFKERLQANPTEDGCDEEIRDVVIGILRLLPHTPVHALGINSVAHWEMESVEQWHTLGHTLAPKSPWGCLLEQPGMRSLTMEGVRTDDCAGQIRVKVEPSSLVSPGVSVEVNDHFQVKSPGESAGAGQILGILEEHWIKARDRGMRIIERLRELPEC